MSNESDRDQFELLAFRLHVYGQEAADRKVIRALARSPFWLDTRILLCSHGFTSADIAELMRIHARGCPCWDCVVRLYRAVFKTRLGRR